MLLNVTFDPPRLEVAGYSTIHAGASLEPWRSRIPLGDANRKYAGSDKPKNSSALT